VGTMEELREPAKEMGQRALYGVGLAKILKMT
jgi:hypothetical protein